MTNECLTKGEIIQRVGKELIPQGNPARVKADLARFGAKVHRLIPGPDALPLGRSHVQTLRTAVTEFSAESETSSALVGGAVEEGHVRAAMEVIDATEPSLGAAAQ